MINLEKRTLGELALKAAKKYKKKAAFRVFRERGVYNELNYTEFGRRARIFAWFLINKGIKINDRVMILAENCPEWPIAYFGIALAGAVSVPVLTDFTEEQMYSIAQHSQVSCVCVTERTMDKAARLINTLPYFILNNEELFSNEKEDFKEAENSLNDINTKDHDPASIIYTSGTTGFSKGVVLSHKNLISTSLASRSFMKIYPRDRVLSVIPLAHTYECTIGLLTPLLSGASITYLDKPPSPSIMLPAMQAVRPTAMITVPLFIEKIYHGLILPKLENNPLYKWRITRNIVIKAAGHSLLAAMGSSLRFFGIGGAALAEDTEIFLKKSGFPYSIGYGLTETSPLVTATTPYRFPLRSSGRAIPGVEIRISEEEEIQVRGPNVMMGYFRDEDQTTKAFTPDAWFKTGDLGYLDKKGNLYIRGRLKALIVGPSGENVYPEEIESMLHSSFLVEDALVIPGSKGELVALIVLSEKAQTAFAALAEMLEDLKQNINKRLAIFSRINRIEVHNEPFEKTPTRKIKRFLYQENNSKN